jgi:hypothetical protein
MVLVLLAALPSVGPIWPLSPCLKYTAQLTFCALIAARPSASFGSGLPPFAVSPLRGLAMLSPSTNAIPSSNVAGS